MNTQGYIHVYYGNGKGKTSILNGMVIRALGANKKISYIRFLKNQETNENKIFEKLNVTIKNYYHSSKKFIWEMNEEEILIFKNESLEGYKQFKKDLKSESIDFIFLDEVLGVIENNFVSKEEFIKDLKSKNKNIEIIISGRKTFEELNEVANLISHVEEIKHYYRTGVKARDGVEF